MFLQKINEEGISAGSELCTQLSAVGASNFRPKEDADSCDEVGHMLYQGPTGKEI